MKEVFIDILLKHTAILGTDIDKAAEEINTLYQKELLNARIDKRQVNEIDKRRELITSKEYWRAMIGNKIWLSGYLSVKPEPCDELAKKIVDKFFMAIIGEIKNKK